MLCCKFKRLDTTYELIFWQVVETGQSSQDIIWNKPLNLNARIIFDATFCRGNELQGFGSVFKNLMQSKVKLEIIRALCLKPPLNDQTFLSNIVLEEHVLLFSHLFQLKRFSSKVYLKGFPLSDVWSNTVCPFSHRTFCLINTVLDENV